MIKELNNYSPFFGFFALLVASNFYPNLTVLYYTAAWGLLVVIVVALCLSLVIFAVPEFSDNLENKQLKPREIPKRRKYIRDFLWFVLIVATALFNLPVLSVVLIICFSLGKILLWINELLKDAERAKRLLNPEDAQNGEAV